MSDKINRVVSFSGGKDSTAMLLMMIERNMTIDEIVFFDTGWEWGQVYENVKLVEKMISVENIMFFWNFSQG